jgi:hypothetical protein
MRMRIRAWWETTWLPAVILLAGGPLAFVGAGWAFGREVTFVPICTIGPCPPYAYVELDLRAGWVAVGLLALAVAAAWVVRKRLDR